jgi:PAS domain-containing protein
METGDLHSHDWARQVVDCTSYAVVVADNNGVIRGWNESARALFGYTAAEAVGQRVELIIPQSLRAAHSPSRESPDCASAPEYTLTRLSCVVTFRPGML